MGHDAATLPNLTFFAQAMSRITLNGIVFRENISNVELKDTNNLK